MYAMFPHRQYSADDSLRGNFMHLFNQIDMKEVNLMSVRKAIIVRVVLIEKPSLRTQSLSESLINNVRQASLPPISTPKAPAPVSLRDDKSRAKRLPSQTIHSAEADMYLEPSPTEAQNQT